MSLFSKNTYRSGILSATILNIIAKGLNFLISVLLAKYFIPAQTDIYLFGWNIISIVIAFTGAIDLLVLLPAYIKKREGHDKTAANDLANTLFGLYFMVATVWIVITLCFPVLTYSIISGFTQDQLSQNSSFIQFSGIWLLLSVLNTYFSNLLIGNKYFAAAVIGQVFISFFTIGCLLLWHSRFGIDSFFFSQLIAQLVCCIFYIFFIRKSIGFYFKIKVRQLPSNLWKELISLVATATPVLFRNYLGFYLLSKMGTGYLSSYNYGSALANIPDIIFTSQIISMAGVKLSEASATQNRDQLFSTYDHLTKHIVFFITGLAIFMSLCSPLFIHLIYGNSNLKLVGFNMAILTLTALSLALPFKCIDVLNNRLFASLQKIAFISKITLPLHILSIFVLLAVTRLWAFSGFLAFQLIVPVFFVIVEFILLRTLFSRRMIIKKMKNLGILFLCAAIIYFGVLFLMPLFGIPSVILEMIVIGIIVLVLGLLINQFFNFTDIPRSLFLILKGYVKRNRDKPII